MKLYLFDDRVADEWAPFALTRPCCELRFGIRLLRESIERFAGTATAGILTRPWLTSFREENTPSVLAPDEAADGEDRLLLCSRFVPDPNARFRAPSAPSVLHAGDAVAGAWLPAGEPFPDPSWLAEPSSLPKLAAADLPGRLLSAVWHLVTEGRQRLLQDLEVALRESPPRPSPPAGLDVVGSGPVHLASDVRIEPGVLFDTREGPIWLDEQVEVRAGTRLAGPLYAGARCRLLGGSFSSLSAGPRSYLRGEIESSTVWGYSNKAHDGFLGHAYLGRWVNLGALTTNSDLKNNYRTVRVGPRGSETDTGCRKLGCFLGDHVKTGIGLLLNTGTIVGAGSNLYGNMPPRWVPPFAWGSGGTLQEYRKNEFLRTAEIVMGRREVPYDEVVRAWWNDVWEAAHRAHWASASSARSDEEEPPR